MYLLEETEEAYKMRRKVEMLLFSSYEPNVRLALQIIKGGGFYNTLLQFDEKIVCRIVNSCAYNFLSVTRKGKYKVYSYFFERMVRKCIKTGLFRLINNDITVTSYIPNPCHLKYFALFFLDCENVSQMKILTQSHTHKAILDITKFILKEQSVTIKDSSLFNEIITQRD